MQITNASKAIQRLCEDIQHQRKKLGAMRAKRQSAHPGTPSRGERDKAS
jgi:hypothetical protein